MGSCSGFPICCNAFFSFVWATIYLEKYSTPGWRRKYSQIIRKRLDEIDYIPCPLCLLSKSFVSVKRCTDKCGHYSECASISKLRKSLLEKK